MIPKMPTPENLRGPEVVTTVPSLLLGRLYAFAGYRGPDLDGRHTWSVHPGTYRLVTVARDVRTWQTQVVFAGVDRAETFICSLADWVDGFTLIPGQQRPEPPQSLPPPEPASPLVEKRAGTIDANWSRG